jgi:hypothetical protein
MFLERLVLLRRRMIISKFPLYIGLLGQQHPHPLTSAIRT